MQFSFAWTFLFVLLLFGVFTGGIFVSSRWEGKPARDALFETIAWGSGFVFFVAANYLALVLQCYGCRLGWV